MHVMYGATPIFATNPVNLWKTSDRKLITIKKISGKMAPTSGRAQNLAPHFRSALTVDQLALEETFYVFDYGNAM